MAVIKRGDWPPGVEGPLSELERIRAELDTLFHRFEPLYASSLSGSLSATNVSEDADSFLVEIDVAGAEGHEIELSADGRSLTVSLSQEIRRLDVAATETTESAETKTVQSTVRFPVDVDPDGMEAKCAARRLTVRLPKAKSSGPKKITVKPDPAE